MTHQLYFSKRGHPLVTTEVSDKPILTVENYCKWYSIQVLMPNGDVEELPHSIISEVDELLPTGCAVIDHNFHPQLLETLSVYLDYDYSSEAAELITGRYTIEINETYGILTDDERNKIIPKAINPHSVIIKPTDCTQEIVDKLERNLHFGMIGNDVFLPTVDLTKHAYELSRFINDKNVTVFLSYDLMQLKLIELLLNREVFVKVELSTNKLMLVDTSSTPELSNVELKFKSDVSIDDLRIVQMLYNIKLSITELSIDNTSTVLIGKFSIA